MGEGESAAGDICLSEKRSLCCRKQRKDLSLLRKRRKQRKELSNQKTQKAEKRALYSENSEHSTTLNTHRETPQSEKFGQFCTPSLPICFIWWDDYLKIPILVGFVPTVTIPIPTNHPLLFFWTHSFSVPKRNNFNQIQDNC